jgi:SAM-dependent methyltransferase
VRAAGVHKGIFMPHCGPDARICVKTPHERMDGGVDHEIPTPETHRMAGTMRRHWWYRGRRVVVARLARRAGVTTGDVLDCGCGTGHMGRVLKAFGTVTGVDASADALKAGNHDDYVRLVLASGLEDPAFPAGTFDLIALLDVLEHVEHDTALLSGLAERLNVNGAIAVSVPLWPELFGETDRVAGHYRRYTPTSFLECVRDAGLEVVASTGYVVALLPLARLARHGVLAGKADATEDLRVPWGPLNATLSAWAMLEGLVGGDVGLPPGLSMVAILRPANAATSVAPQRRAAR